jgi:hypothetical protein
MFAALHITSKNMTLNQSFLSDSSTLSLESLNAVALSKFFYKSSQRQCMFLQNVMRHGGTQMNTKFTDTNER